MKKYSLPVNRAKPAPTVSCFSSWEKSIKFLDSDVHNVVLPGASPVTHVHLHRNCQTACPYNKKN